MTPAADRSSSIELTLGSTSSGTWYSCLSTCQIHRCFEILGSGAVLCSSGLPARSSGYTKAMSWSSLATRRLCRVCGWPVYCSLSSIAGSLVSSSAISAHVPSMTLPLAPIRKRKLNEYHGASPDGLYATHCRSSCDSAKHCHLQSILKARPSARFTDKRCLDPAERK